MTSHHRIEPVGAVRAWRLFFSLFFFIELFEEIERRPLPPFA
jgi:hypothetical protein